MNTWTALYHGGASFSRISLVYTKIRGFGSAKQLVQPITANPEIIRSIEIFFIAHPFGVILSPAAGVVCQFPRALCQKTNYWLSPADGGIISSVK